MLCSDLKLAFLKECPNGRIPPKMLHQAIVAEHNECGPILLEHGSTLRQTDAISIVVRGMMAKLRELAMPSERSVARLNAVKRQARVRAKFHMYRLSKVTHAYSKGPQIQTE